MDKIEDIIKVAAVPGVGPRTYRLLREHFGSADCILGADAASLLHIKGLRRDLVDRLVRAEQTDSRPELELAQRHGVEILHQGSSSYPQALLSTFDPPILLYVRGCLMADDNIAIGMVGTRQPSHYGRSQAARFSSLLARTGFTVVSGLARGIDSVSHRGTLTAGGRTIAVLGSGLAHIYPEENRDLAIEISQQGAVVSEFAMETGPNRENFPRRNRIIAGLSLGVLVVEAPKRSGALITARIANDQGREIFAIPGRIDQRNAEGANGLIADGQAKLVQGLEDILEEFGPIADALLPPVVNGEAASIFSEDESLAMGKPGNGLSGRSRGPQREAKVLAVLGREELHIDEICTRCGLPVQEVVATLMMLELKHLVRQLPGKIYLRRLG